MSPQKIHGPLEIAAQRCLEHHWFVGDRMAKAKHRSMQSLPHQQGRIGAASDIGLAQVRSTVHVVACQWMTDVGHVNANLMRAPRTEFQLDERKALEEFERSVESLRGLAAVVETHGIPLANRWMLTQRQIDEIGQWIGMTLDECDVPLLRGAPLELLAKPPVRGLRLGGDHDATGVLVESVHHAGARVFTTDLRKFAARAVQEMPCETMDERSRLVASCGMHDQSWLLVDDDQFVILEEDVEWDLFGCDLVARRWREGRNDDVTMLQPRTRLRNAPVDGHGLLIDQPLQRRSAQERHSVYEIAVEALREVVLDAEGDADRLVIVACCRSLVDREQCIAVDRARRGEELHRIGIVRSLLRVPLRRFLGSAHGVSGLWSIATRRCGCRGSRRICRRRWRDRLIGRRVHRSPLQTANQRTHRFLIGDRRARRQVETRPIGQHSLRHRSIWNLIGRRHQRDRLNPRLRLLREPWHALRGSRVDALERGLCNIHFAARLGNRRETEERCNFKGDRIRVIRRLSTREHFAVQGSRLEKPLPAQFGRDGGVCRACLTVEPLSAHDALQISIRGCQQRKRRNAVDIRMLSRHIAERGGDVCIGEFAPSRITRLSLLVLPPVPTHGEREHHEDCEKPVGTAVLQPEQEVVVDPTLREVGLLHIGKPLAIHKVGKSSILSVSMPVRMLVSDLDGTLLDSEGSVSQANRDAIARARDAGMEVVFATGRSWLECRSIAQAVLGEGLIITAGGAALHDIATGRCEDCITISTDLVLHCTESLLLHGHLAHLLKDASRSGYDYLLVGNRELDAASRWWFEIHPVATRSLAALPSDVQERQVHLQHVLRVGTVAHQAELGDVTAALLREVPEHLSIKHWPALVSAGKAGADTHLLEIFDATVDKWTMVQRLCLTHNIDESSVATVGDGLNDIGMLRNSRLSFAVANAMPDVASHAAERAPSNDAHAIAWVVDRLLRDA